MQRLDFLFAITLCLYPLLIQAQYTRSPYSYLGIGDLLPDGTIRNIGMAGVGISNFDVNQSNSINPALICFNQYVYLDLDGYIKKTTFSTNNSNQSDTRSLSPFVFRNARLGFPVLSQVTIELGTNLYSQVNYNNLYQETSNNPPILRLHHFQGEGSIRKNHISVGWLFLDRYANKRGGSFESNGASFGLTVSEYSGTVTHSFRSSYFNSSPDDTTYTNLIPFNHQYRFWSARIGLFGSGEFGRIISQNQSKKNVNLGVFAELPFWTSKNANINTVFVGINSLTSIDSINSGDLENLPDLKTFQFPLHFVIEGSYEFSIKRNSSFRRKHKKQRLAKTSNIKKDIEAILFVQYMQKRLQNSEFRAVNLDAKQEESLSLGGEFHFPKFSLRTGLQYQYQSAFQNNGDYELRFSAGGSIPIFRRILFNMALQLVDRKQFELNERAFEIHYGIRWVLSKRKKKKEITPRKTGLTKNKT